jgi:hypothetical protein
MMPYQNTRHNHFKKASAVKFSCSISNSIVNVSDSIISLSVTPAQSRSHDNQTLQMDYLRELLKSVSMEISVESSVKANENPPYIP